MDSSLCVRCLLTLSLLVSGSDSGAVVLTSDNIDSVLENNDLVLINFYADWCRFSSMLAPIWDQGADKVATEFSDKKVVLGKVDCPSEGSLGSRFHITKYPTIKVVQNGQLAKKEFRGQRTVDSFVEFVREHVKDPILEIKDAAELHERDDTKRYLIGHFPSSEDPGFENFKKVGTVLKNDCIIKVGFGAVVSSVNSGAPLVSFLAATARSSSSDSSFPGPLSDYSSLLSWATERCSPLVREITFENAEELTEEALPFLILFHHPDDSTSVKEYTEMISRDLTTEKGKVNFLTADGLKFAHPLNHLGKTKTDLPLIAIDSFRHMYLFSKYEDIRLPGRVKSFLEDMYNGKLHREYHYGPDKTTKKEENKEENKENKDSEQKEEDVKPKDSEGDEQGEVKEEDKKSDDTKHIPRSENEKDVEKSSEKTEEISSDPPESQFIHLGPSKNRYTILRDEF